MRINKLTLSWFSQAFVVCLALLGLSHAQDRLNGKKQYVFQIEEKKRVLLVRFPFFYEGHLNDLGAFVPDPKAPPIKYEYKVVKKDVGEWMESLEKTKFPIYNLNRGGGMADTVYQYCGGNLLMPGALAVDDFVPLIDETNKTVQLITLEEYLKTYDPERHIRIYNLPGRIVLKSEAEKQKPNAKK